MSSTGEVASAAAPAPIPNHLTARGPHEAAVVLPSPERHGHPHPPHEHGHHNHKKRQEGEEGHERVADHEDRVGRDHRHQ
ncbi:hypothetical protein ABH917_003800 [Thermobifida halotolerans]|uniref:hypothetical protein n=1 Tax=Thermobifida halotolerans TaxID=483545 RepID=UPI0035165662